MDLRKSLFILPNLFTLSSVFCGFYAMTVVIGDPTSEDMYRAALLILFAMFFDIMDGRVARLTKTQSSFGVQLDSLADVFSFGAAPALLMYQWSLKSLGIWGVIAGFVWVACGAMRLARFNVLAMSETGAPKKPGKYIMGLPIPAAAGVLIGLVAVHHSVNDLLPSSPAVTAGVMYALSFFMVSSFRFRSFKDLKPNVRTMGMVGFALASSVALALKFHVTVAIIWLLAAYIVIAVAETFLGLSQKGLARARAGRGSADDAEELSDFGDFSDETSLRESDV